MSVFHAGVAIKSGNAPYRFLHEQHFIAYYRVSLTAKAKAVWGLMRSPPLSQFTSPANQQRLQQKTG